MRGNDREQDGMIRLRLEWRGGRIPENHLCLLPCPIKTNSRCFKMMKRRRQPE